MRLKNRWQVNASVRNIGSDFWLRVHLRPPALRDRQRPARDRVIPFEIGVWDPLFIHDRPLFAPLNMWALACALLHGDDEERALLRTLAAHTAKPDDDLSLITVARIILERRRTPRRAGT